MRRYCQMQGNIAWYIFHSEAMPEFAPDIVIKDITDSKYDYVREGYLYDESEDHFNEPVRPIMPTPPDLHAIAQSTLMEEQYQTLLMEMIMNK